jgi:hypothetical protein
MSAKQNVIALVFITIASTLLGQELDDYLNYTIPKGAVKIGPGINRDQTKAFNYFEDDTKKSL